MSSTNEDATFIRYRIILVSVLMAFGLYVTRATLGEIIKNDSFLQDSVLTSHPSTRFELELLKPEEGGTPAAKASSDALQNRVNQILDRKPDEARKLTYPQTLKDNLTQADGMALQTEIESLGGECRLRMSKQQLGGVLGAFFFTYALMQVPAGWLSDRFGPRRALSIYILCWSGLTAITGLVTSLPGVLMARMGCGVAQAGAYPASSAIVRRWFPLSRRGSASSLISFGGRLGATFSPPLTTGLIFFLGGWRAALWAFGAFGILIAAGYWLIVRDRPALHDGCNEAERELIGLPKEPPSLSFSELLSVLKACLLSRSLWLNSVAQFCVNVGWAFLLTWLPTYLRDSKGVDLNTGAVMVSLVLACGMAGQLIGGWASDASVRRFGLRIGRVLPICVASTCAGCAYLGCLGLDNVWAIVACCGLVSMMTDVGNPSIWGFMQDVGGRGTGTVFGWANMWGNFGAAFSSNMVPILMAWGSASGSGQSLVFIGCASAFFIAGLAASGMDATKRLQPENV